MPSGSSAWPYVGQPPGTGVIPVSEDQPLYDSPDGSATPDADLHRDDALSSGTRLSDTVVGHLTEQARRTATAARARRVVNEGDEPGVLDLAPLRELLAELMAELDRLRMRERIARALRQAADIIEGETPAR
jgi:hypothetical protein